MNRYLSIHLLVVLSASLGCGATSHFQSVGSQPKHSSSDISEYVAYDVAELELGDYDTVVVPKNATVQIDEAADRIRIELKKTIGYQGDYEPEKSLFNSFRKFMGSTELTEHEQRRLRASLESQRSDLGCAWRREGNKLYLATFGALQFLGLSSNDTAMTVYLPPGIRVEKTLREELSCSDSRSLCASYLRRHSIADQVWYEPVKATLPDQAQQAGETELAIKEPVERWIPLPDEPDLARMEQQQARPKDPK